MAPGMETSWEAWRYTFQVSATLLQGIVIFQVLLWLGVDRGPFDPSALFLVELRS